MAKFSMGPTALNTPTQASGICLQWRHNGRDGVSNHQPHDCLLNRLSWCRSKKTSKLRATGLCEGNSPGIGEFPAQKASKAGNVSIWWRHYECKWCSGPHHDNAFRNTGNLGWYPPVIYEFPLRRTSNSEFWYFLWCHPEQAVEETVECKTGTNHCQQMYCNCNTFPIYVERQNVIRTKQISSKLKQVASNWYYI